MNDEMKPWLIQRAKFEDRSHREGVDSVLSFDYMGSSEYEWGAIGKSLKRIRESIGSYDLHTVTDPEVVTPKLGALIDEDKQAVVRNVFGDRLVLLCRTGSYSKIVPHIMALSKGNVRLKEPSYFEAQFDPLSKPPSIAELKRKGSLIRRVRGDRLFTMDGTMYTVEKGTNRVRGPNEYRLGVNCWWDLGHDWIMFFERDGKGRKLMAAIQNVPAPKEQPTTV